MYARRINRGFCLSICLYTHTHTHMHTHTHKSQSVQSLPKRWHTDKQTNRQTDGQTEYDTFDTAINLR